MFLYLSWTVLIDVTMYDRLMETETSLFHMTKGIRRTSGFHYIKLLDI